jgi:hypothetical protein
MARRENFDTGKGPQIFYHGSSFGLRHSIESKGLVAGYLDPDGAEIAKEYANPDLYEVRRHSNMEPEDPDEPDSWHIVTGTIPPSHIKRVGHVISHMDKNGEYFDEVHWHKLEDCPQGIDYHSTFPKGHPDAPKGARPHPTDPTKVVYNYTT